MEITQRIQDFHDKFRDRALFESQLWFFMSIEDRNKISQAIKVRKEEIALDKLIDIAENKVKSGK